MVAVCACIILFASLRLNLMSNMQNLAISVFVLMVSSRVFGCISGIYYVIGKGEPITWDAVLKTGIVYYGGLIGMLVSFRECVKRKKDDYHSLDALAVSIPFFHIIARFGCFLSGCCYGKELITPFSVNYTTLVHGEINTATRIPVQLIESLIEFFILLYLLYLVTRSNWKERHILNSYLLLYSVSRFGLEFLRGDEERGVIWGISFSQAISIIIWIYLLMKRNSKERKD